MKIFKKDPIKILAENYYQCIYYLTVTDCGDGQDLNLDGDDPIPKDIQIDKGDMLLIHSDIGTYNLHLINTKTNLLFKYVKKIEDILNSNPDIDYEKLNKELQDRAVYW